MTCDTSSWASIKRQSRTLRVQSTWGPASLKAIVPFIKKKNLGRCFQGRIVYEHRLPRPRREQICLGRQSVDWPFGNKQIHHRVQRGGLISAVTESFHPSTPHDYAVFLEDDIEVTS